MIHICMANNNCIQGRWNWSSLVISCVDITCFDSTYCHANNLRSLNKCISEKPASLNLVYVAGKGDWKWKREWLQESRHYNRAARSSSGEGMICRRCFAGSAGKPWLDIQFEKFNDPEDRRAAAETSFLFEYFGHFFFRNKTYQNVILKFRVLFNYVDRLFEC